jgi:hypothetical protein
MPVNFEENLYNGGFLCIYALLQHLLDFSFAESVAVLQRSDSLKWKVVREVCADSGKTWTDLLKDPDHPGVAKDDSSVQETLETLYLQTGQPIGWERPAFGGAEDPILIFRVWSPDREYPPHIEGLVVAIFHPQGIKPDPSSKDFATIQKWHRWTIEWFAIAGNRYLALRELWAGDKSGDRGAVGVGAMTLGRWPMSFFEVSRLIEHEVRNRGSRQELEITDLCLKGLHLDEGISCLFQGCDGLLRCHKEPGRKQMAPLARLSPLRLLDAEHGTMKPWEAGEDEHKRLLSVLNRFSEALSELYASTKKLDSRSGKFLTIHFARSFWKEWLATGERQRFMALSSASAAEKAKMLSCSARLAHFALEHMPRDNETMEALLWALNKYTTETLRLDPRLEIGSHLLRLARNEPALHALKPYYRDHFFHAIEVCFLGHLLLDTEYAPGKPLCDLVQELMYLKSREEVLRAWYLASLVHDVGYAVDVLKSAAEMLRFFECSKPLKDLTKGVEDAINTLSANLTTGLANVEQPGRDHGVVAAEHLEQLIHMVSEKLPPWPGYEHSVRAIRVHNVHSEAVEFRKEPLAFLLVLCDTIQEWNRPHLRHATAPSEILTSLFGAESHDALKTTGPLKRVSVNIKPDGEKLSIEPLGQLKFDLEFGPEIQKDAGVFNLWLSNCSDLQRLKMDGLPFNIVLQYQTPQFRVGLSHPQRQMDRLRQAADETHLSVLTDWFPNGEKNPAIQYETDDDVSETLTVDVRKLTEKRRIRADMDAIRKLLSTWKHYSDDRDFAGDYAPVHPGYPHKRYPG